MSSFVFYCNKESYKHIWRSMKQYRYCKILQFKHFKNMDLKNLSLHLNTTSCFLKTSSSLIPPQLRFSDWNVLRLKCSEKTPQLEAPIKYCYGLPCPWPLPEMQNHSILRLPPSPNGLPPGVQLRPAIFQAPKCVNSISCVVFAFKHHVTNQYEKTAIYSN